MRKAACFGVILSLASCGVPEVPVQQRWADAIRNYALVPVYPMREDLFVGDVRIHNAGGSAYSINSRLLGHVPVEAGLEAKERTRPTYGKSDSPPSPKDDDPATWGQPESNLSQGGTANRLRLAALPKIDAARVTSADASGGGVAGLWNIIVGAGVQSEQTLLVSLSGIETLELVDTEAIPQFVAWLTRRLEAADADNRLLYAVCANAQRFGENAVEDTRISMVTRALYARGIDYSYGDTFGAALRASAGEGGVDGSVVTEPVVSSVEDDETKPPAPPSVDLSKLTPGAPGVSARISRATRDGLSLTEVYERPMAFGADVFALNPFNLIDDLPKRCEDLGIEGSTSGGGIILTAPASGDKSPLE